jgi:hypothetical protein
MVYCVSARESYNLNSKIPQLDYESSLILVNPILGLIKYS